MSRGHLNSRLHLACGCQGCQTAKGNAGNKFNYWISASASVKTLTDSSLVARIILMDSLEKCLPNFCCRGFKANKYISNIWQFNSSWDTYIRKLSFFKKYPHKNCNHFKQRYSQIFLINKEI